MFKDFLIGIVIVIYSVFLFMFGAVAQKRITPSTIPLVQTIDESSGLTDELVVRPPGIVINNYKTNDTMGYHELHWSKCKSIVGVVVQTPKDIQAEISIFYKDLCAH
jgi:hypothetical protein